MSVPAVKPESVAAEILARLASGGDPVRAEGAHRYFREEVDFYGWTSAQVRELATGVHAKVKGVWSLAEAVRLAEILLPEKKFEAKSVGILVYLKFKKSFTRVEFDRIKGWLAKDYCANWASVDALCPEGLGYLLAAHPDLAGRILDWTAHKNRWVRRGAVVAFITLARRGRMLDQAYAVAEAMFGTDDDLLQKATGWMLREAGKTDEARLERFLRRHGPQIPRTSLRYAIERFPEAKRKDLMAATRPKR